MQFGSSLVLALAVTLWLAYFVPTWVRRRNYLATEQNAIRMQQALHSLATTSDLGGARVRADGRGVSEQERRIKRARAEAERAERERDEAARRALPAVTVPRSAEDRQRAARATRRGRLVTSLVTLVGIVAVGVGIALGATAGVWWVLVAGVVTVLAGVAGLQRLARIANAQRLAARVAVGAERRPKAERRADATIDFSVSDAARPAAQPAAEVQVTEPLDGWVPVPVPKPLYLERSSAESLTAPEEESGTPGRPGPDGPGGGVEVEKVNHLELLREAARRSEQKIRDAHAQPGIATFSTRASAAMQGVPLAQTAATRAGLAQSSPQLSEAVLNPIVVAPVEKRPSRWASMGILDEVEPGMGDLDAALRRRRVG
ncbi:hypothetical protein HDC34_001404 [Pseudoclavibacter sp. JAI123]|uniref:hypothetical protein n=1 Tax=Pseudoclavibacter sp. JAI123 TaxID=2723065 RepID=UPI0015CECE82|nr:hypothetical protein [Pseudoclavibacter sp. JAI123]NYF13110.1 hypothetical protein [Pseudoclavibacter sp. JAI123]